MLQPIKVSVVIPTRNRPLLLLKAVESVLTQDTEEHVEVIVVDSGDSSHMEELLVQQFPRVRYFRIDSAGPAKARQYGSVRARGKFLTYLDDDDIYLPHKLRLQLQFLHKHPEVDLCFCDTCYWNGETVLGGPRHESYPQIWDCSPSRIDDVYPWFRFRSGGLYKAFLIGLPMYPQSMMLRKQFFDKMGGWDETITGFGECHDFSLRATHHGCLGYQNTVLFLLRRQYGMHMTEDWCEAWKEEAVMIDSLFSAYPEAIREAMRPYMKDYFAMTGWRMFHAKHFDLAKRFYCKAYLYGNRNPRMLIKFLLSSLGTIPIKDVRQISQ